MTLYQLRYRTARWEVVSKDPEGPIRYRLKRVALAYAEGLNNCGREANVQRHGPGFGRRSFYYPGADNTTPAWPVIPR